MPSIMLKHAIPIMRSLHIISDMHVWSWQYGRMWRPGRPTDSHSVTPINDARPPIGTLSSCSITVTMGANKVAVTTPFHAVVLGSFHLVFHLSFYWYLCQLQPYGANGSTIWARWRGRCVRSISDDRVAVCGSRFILLLCSSYLTWVVL